MGLDRGVSPLGLGRGRCVGVRLGVRWGLLCFCVLSGFMCVSMGG